MATLKENKLDAETAYVIWSNAKQAWLGSEGEGFHARLHEAGVFEHDEAIEICAKAVDGKVPFDLLPLWYEDVHNLVDAFYNCVDEHP